MLPPRRGRAGARRAAALWALGTVLLADTPLAASADPRRPDVVLAIVESLGTTGLNARSLPSLDRIAARGRRFDNAFATTAASGAARLSLLTGVRPERAGFFPEGALPGGASLLSERFRAAGYLVAPPAGTPEVTPLPGAAEVLGERKDQPAFVIVSIRGGEGPPRPDLAAPFAEVAPPPIPVIAFQSLDPFARPGALLQPRGLRADERKRQAEQFAASVGSVEAQLATLADRLDRAGSWSRTVVVVVGDTGPDRGAHGLLPTTDVLFDDTLRIPLVIAAPGVRQPGAPTNALAEAVDVYPTLLALTGLPPGGGLDGASLVPTLEDPSAVVRREVVSTVARNAGEIGRSARSQRYRYTEWPDGSEELYDHERDPRELVNLASDPSSAGERERMKGLIASRYAGPAPSAPAAPADDPVRPNVLLLLADDLGAQVGALGFPVTTPNIDRLAGRGRLFERAYAQAPSCSPSRSSLLSGWRPERTDIWNNLTPVRQHLEGAVPLQEHFKANGYYTARVGKVYEPMFASEFRWDFDDQSIPGEEPTRRDEDQPVGGFWQATDREDEQEPDGIRARIAARLMEANRDKPFFIAVGFAKPHLKWVAPKKYFDLYPPESIVLPSEPADDLGDVPALAAKTRAQERPGVALLGREPRGFNPDPAFRRQATAAYYACVSFLDAQVGFLMQTLRQLKLKDRTIVVLLGDHGYHLGEHGGMYRKDTLFEEALRTVLLVSAPQVKDAGRPSGVPVELLDVYPTLVDLAGLPPLPGLDGRSLRPLLDDPAAAWRPAALSFRKARAPSFGLSIRTERYRYTRWPDGSEELYDHASDPGELKSLVREGAAASTLVAMRRLHAAGPGRPIGAPQAPVAMPPPE